MKKIILTFIATLLAGFSTAIAENVAEVGGAEYPTLAAAIDAVSDGGTITMIADVDGAPGMTVPSGKNFTVDFNGKTYTLNKPGAGSTNTETLGFQLLTGSTITFKNGTINISEENLTEAVAPAKNIKRIIQNYANLTLEDMTIDGTNQYGDKTLVVSLNNGTCAITGNTSITAGSEPVDPIMDVSQWSSYDGPVVTINTTGTIGGNIDINVQAIKSTSLTVENGNVQGTIVNSTSTFDVPVSVSGGTFEEALPENYLAAGFILSKNADGTYGVINEANAVAQIGDYGYETLAEAFAAVQDGGVIELLNDVTLEENVTSTLSSGESFTLNFNGKKITGGKIALNSGVMVSTDVDFGNGEVSSTTIETRIFSVADEGVVVRMNVDGKNAYKVVTPVDEVAYIDIDENGEKTASTATNVIDLAQLSGIVAVDTDQFYYASEGTIIGGLIFLANKTGKLILADGVTLTMNSAVGNNNVKGNLEVYGQEGQTGNLVCNGKSDVAVNMLSYTQKGGNVKSAENKSAAVNAKTIVVNAGTLDVATNSGSYPALGRDNSEATVTINGGVVTAKGTGTYNTGIKAGDIIITGGQVTAEGGVGMYATNVSTTTLSLKELDDFILSDSYDGTVKIAAGVTLYDRDANYKPYSGTLTDEQKEAIKGHTLVLASILRLETDDEAVLELYDTLDKAIADVEDGQFIHLTADVTLEDDIEVELDEGEAFSLKFGTADIDGNGHHILLPEKVSVNTDKQTKIFAVLPELAETHAIKETQNEDGTYTYKYTTVEAVAYNKETGVRYATLQGAIDEATAGNTIVLMPAIEYPENVLDETVTINKNITIEGGDYQVTSMVTTGNLYGPRLDPAFRITGRGSVTLNKVNLVAPYVVPGHDGPGIYDQYTSGSVGILVDKNFNDSLVINYSTITTTGRGIDIQSVGGGFVLNMMHSTITTTDDDPDTAYGEEADDFDPTKVYINSFDGDPYGRGRGINFDHDATTIVANIQFSKIQGFAYPINVTANSGKVELNMTDCTTWGRDVINNWGDHSTFNLTNVTANGYNNETSADNESFAAIVDYKTADYNFYNIDGLRVVANVEAADAALTSASENFIDLRGTNATVKIVGNSGYEIADDLKDRVGFVNTNLSDDDVPEDSETDAFKRMIDKTVNNRIYFDDQAKAYFNYWFEIIEPFEYDYDNDGDDELIRIAIDDKKDHTNLYPVVPLEVKVMMTIAQESPTGDPEDIPDPKVLYYGNLQDAFNSEHFEATAQIQLLADVDLDEDIIVRLDRGMDFSLLLLDRDDNLCRVNVSNEASIKLPPLVYAYCDEAQAETLFTSADESLKVIKGVSGGIVTYYVPANVYHADTYEAATGDDPDADDYEPNIDGGLLWIFKDLLSTDADAMLQITPDCYVRLEANVTLDETYTLPIGGDVDSEEVFYLDLNNKTISGEYKSLVMRLGTAIYTTGTIDIFSSIDPEYTVVYDVLDDPITTTYTDFEGNSKTVSFTHKYYLMKDGLAVIVDPSTYCGDRLTPNFIVKKKVVDAGTGEESWVELVEGTDYTWSLVPPATDDANDKTYIDAKTYVQAIVIEGITFQGTRKADFTILPRDIKDVTASGNEQPWTEDGYAPMSDEEEGIVGIEDLILLQYFCKNHGDAANPILEKYVEEIDEITGELLKSGDYIISVEDGPETDPAGYYKEIDTYSKVITITAVEGGNYTGTLKLDFTILPEDMIDISKCMVISDATYTSAPLPPTTEGRIQVIWKNPGTGEEIIVDPSAYTIEANAATESYVDAKTYSNALTIVAKPEEVGAEPDYHFYGTLVADYVIKQRDLADTSDSDDENDNNGYVVLEAYAGTPSETLFPILWTGDELTPVINSYGATADKKNNINLILNAKEDPNAEDPTAAPGDVEWKLIPADYSYTIEPAPMVDPGIYKVIFTGRGNFTGMREVNVMVLKDINELADNIKMPYQIIPDNLALTPSQMKGIEVKDGNKVLVENEEYTLVIKGGKPGEIFDEENPIYVKGKYYACFYGKEPYYTGQYVDDFRAFFEYIGWDTNPVAGTGTNIYNNPTSIAKKPDTNGNIIASSGLEYDGTNTTPVSVRITDVSDSLNLKAEITYIDNINDGTVTACDPTKEIVKVKPTFQIVAGLDNGAARYFTFNIVGVQDNAFKDLPIIHCLDLTQIEGYTPDNLTRSEDGPFNYYPVQSLVYLDGCSDVTGTNYIYKKGENDFRCEELKIYDDIKGDQQGFETDADYIGGGHAWEFRNIYQFVADKVTNTRVFLAGQHYTTCLPYKLQMNSALKAYTLDAASDNIFGFKQYTAKELDQFTPYVLIPSKGGNLLNNDESTVCYVTPTSNRGFLPLDEGGNRRYDFATPTGHIMYGSNIYMGSSSTYPTVEGLYIMQSKNQWKRIPAGKTYNNACVLPMRGYIMLPNHPQISGANPSRESSDGPEYISAKYMDVDGVAEISIDANDDWTDAEVYDLQGRKVDTTARLPKGVYIVNGQKRIRK